jgi:hypothetical protein
MCLLLGTQGQGWQWLDAMSSEIMYISGTNLSVRRKSFEAWEFLDIISLKWNISNLTLLAIGDKIGHCLCKQFHYMRVIQSDKESWRDTFSMSKRLMLIVGV